MAAPALPNPIRLASPPVPKLVNWQRHAARLAQQMLGWDASLYGHGFLSGVCKAFFASSPNGRKCLQILTLCILYGRVCHFFVPPAYWGACCGGHRTKPMRSGCRCGLVPSAGHRTGPEVGNQHMASRLSEYSSECHRSLLRSVGLEVVSRADAETAVAPSSAISIQRVFRLPHLMILAGIDFARGFAAACLEKATEYPGRQLPDPWSAESEHALVAAVIRTLSAVRDRVAANWHIPPREAAILADIARGELCHWVSDAFEDGRDSFARAVLQQGAAAARVASTEDSEGCHPAPPVKRKSQRRGATTDERLTALMATPEGRAQVIAAGGATKVGKLIGRSHGAVVGSAVWKKRINPLLESSRANAQLARQEWDAGRRH